MSDLLKQRAIWLENIYIWTPLPRYQTLHHQIMHIKRGSLLRTFAGQGKLLEKHYCDGMEHLLIEDEEAFG